MPLGHANHFWWRPPRQLRTGRGGKEARADMGVFCLTTYVSFKKIGDMAPFTGLRPQAPKAPYWHLTAPRARAVPRLRCARAGQPAHCYRPRPRSTRPSCQCHCNVIIGLMRTRLALHHRHSCRRGQGTEPSQPCYWLPSGLAKKTMLSARLVHMIYLGIVASFGGTTQYFASAVLLCD